MSTSIEIKQENHVNDWPDNDNVKAPMVGYKVIKNDAVVLKPCISKKVLRGLFAVFSILAIGLFVVLENIEFEYHCHRHPPSNVTSEVYAACTKFYYVDFVMFLFGCLSITTFFALLSVQNQEEAVKAQMEVEMKARKIIKYRTIGIKFGTDIDDYMDLFYCFSRRLTANGIKHTKRSFKGQLDNCVDAVNGLGSFNSIYKEPTTGKEDLVIKKNDIDTLFKQRFGDDVWIKAVLPPIKDDLVYLVCDITTKEKQDLVRQREGYVIFIGQKANDDPDFPADVSIISPKDKFIRDYEHRWRYYWEESIIKGMNNIIENLASDATLVDQEENRETSATT